MWTYPFRSLYAYMRVMMHSLWRKREFFFCSPSLFKRVAHREHTHRQQFPIHCTIKCSACCFCDDWLHWEWVRERENQRLWPSPCPSETISRTSGRLPFRLLFFRRARDTHDFFLYVFFFWWSNNHSPLLWIDLCVRESVFERCTNDF